MVKRFISTLVDGVGFHGSRSTQPLTMHLSPRWGFGQFGSLVCYTHTAPLGLQKFAKRMCRYFVAELI